jgi:[ribosomal protein S5]-alanine N-acetyltransferase
MITSKRLVIKPTTLADAAFILKLLNSPGWIEFIGDRNVYTVAEAETYLTTRLVGINPTKGCGIYSIFLQENDTPIGMSSLVKRDYLEYVDIGYALLPEYEGKGYATEATQAFLQYVQEDLGHQKVVGFCLTSHPASMRIMEKIGMTKGEPFIDTDAECVLYSIEK